MITSYDQDVSIGTKHYQYGLVFDSSAGSQTASGKNIYYSSDAVNIDGTTVSGSKDFIGIGNYFSQGNKDQSQLTDTTIT